MKRWMGWLLALALVVGVGAACSDDEGGDADDGASSEESDSGEISAEAQGYCDELQGFEDDLEQARADGDPVAANASGDEYAAWDEDVLDPAFDDLSPEDQTAVNDCINAHADTSTSVADELGGTTETVPG